MKTKVLIAEDDKATQLQLKYSLQRENFEVVSAFSGKEAVEILKTNTFDVIITDWMMPGMDGIALIRHIRSNVTPLPPIIMMTALASPDAKQYALESGADEYIEKPFDLRRLIAAVEQSVERKKQLAPQIKVPPRAPLFPSASTPKPPMLGVVVAASTGGPPALTELLSRLGAFSNTAFFLVQHGPQWALEVLAQRLNNLTPLNVQIGVRGAKIEPNTMYVSPADVHMVIDAASWTIDLSSEPKENFVRPAADPLFRTAAKAFGPYLTGVVMTGMGRDGTKGAAEIAAVGGKLIAQDPKTCTVDSMPQTMISSGLDCSIVPLEQLADAITKQVREFEKVFRPGR